MISCPCNALLNLILVVYLISTSESEKGPDELAKEPEAMSEVNPTSQLPDESVRRSMRERKPPAYLRDYTTDKEAKESPESRNWETAMNEEMNALIENNIFTLCTLPEGKHSVGGSLGIH